MKFLIAIAVAATPFAARAEEIPAGHVYLGLELEPFLLARGASMDDQKRVTPAGVQPGIAFGPVLSFEIERVLVAVDVVLGGVGKDQAFVGRGGIRAGYVLGEGGTAPYAAIGLARFATGWSPFDNFVTATDATGVVAEAGFLIGRSHRFGRLTAALTTIWPVAVQGIYTPWIGLGLRAQL